MQNLCFLSIAELARHIQRHKVSPLELTQAYLDRIQVDETTVLQVGHAYEVHTDWQTRRPTLPA